jgi:hypothetical protein
MRGSDLGDQSLCKVAGELPARDEATAAGRPYRRAQSGQEHAGKVSAQPWLSRLVGSAGRRVCFMRLRVAARPRRALPLPTARAARPAHHAARGEAGALTEARRGARGSPSFGVFSTGLDGLSDELKRTSVVARFHLRLSQSLIRATTSCSSASAACRSASSRPGGVRRRREAPTRFERRGARTLRSRLAACRTGG